MKYPPFEFCPISRDWSEFGILNLARMSQMKLYRMLQNARVTAFTVSELLMENQQRGKIIPTTQIKVKIRLEELLDLPFALLEMD